MKYEKEMIPIINKYFTNTKGYSIVKNEINSGYGIADVVAAKNINNSFYYAFNNIFEVDLLISMKYNKWIPFESIIQYSSYSSNYLKYNLLKQFMVAGLISRNNNYYKRTKQIEKSKATIVAVEAKLSKWKEAFCQALRYKKFADYCYVALLEKSLKNVDTDLFRNNNIGIIYINKNKEVKSFLRAYKSNEKDNLYRLFVNSLIL